MNAHPVDLFLQRLSVIISAALALMLSASAAIAQTANRIVAVVNDEIITEADVVAQMSALLDHGGLPKPADEDQAGQMRGAVLRRLLEERLILQEAKRLGVTVTSDEVVDELRELRRELGSRAAYERMLQEAGLSEERLKMKVREQLIVQKAVDQEVRLTIVISPADVAEAAGRRPEELVSGDEVRAAHLLIRVTDSRSAAEAQHLAHQLYARALQGESFEQLARTYSEDGHGESGGMLGWVRQGQLLPELDQVLFSLDVDQVSSPIQTRLGFHLVKVMERRSRSVSDAASARQQLQRRLYQEAFLKRLTEWLDRLAEDAYIVILDES